MNQEDVIIRKCCECQKDKELNKKNFFYDNRRLHQGIESYYRKQCRECSNMIHRKYNSGRKRTIYNSIYESVSSKEASDRYIIKLIRDKDKTLKAKDIRQNKELIELYRLRLMLKRELRNDSTTKRADR
jgi:hypothetical protein